MEDKKYMSLDNLKSYDALIKDKILEQDVATFESAKEYTNEAVAQKSSVEFYIWEDND